MPGVMPNASLIKQIRIWCERDPIMVTSCVMGTFGLLAPFLIGDGGRRKEDASTSYAYRIKQVYPPAGAQ